MDPYFFGINPLFLYALLLVLAITGLFLIRINKLNNIRGSGFGLILIVLAIFSGISYSNYMNKPISERKAEQLDLAINQSYGNPKADEFRKALSDLGEKKGNTTGGSTFALEGSKIYLDYVTRKDFNDLVKLYKESKEMN
ncbi:MULTISPECIES: hypothetical protein [Acinetobacter calcoaceticus/baumannii complex]|uniref:hypothetical protein n=1 Tax=Acinetobacter calcoaceticus/baumannii complex TaxID=909768 RepID=UPI0021D303AA|nr:hypothetical protein [Acinetobacter pittii]MCU4525906.1 hypothetical protein [Acinetobacter pittii]MCU4559311.1 hypothetical protein [Acinetobacter pittii]